MTDPSAYDQFMAAFNDIEHHLRVGAYGDPDRAPSGFAKALDEFKRKQPRRISDAQVAELRMLGELRNALTHGRTSSDRRMAVPTEAAVDAVRRVRADFVHPPRIRLHLKLPTPAAVSPETGISDALQLMARHDFSQLLVCDDRGKYVQLLTTNTIARWLSAEFTLNGGLAGEANVGAVLAHREATEAVLVRPDSLTTLEAARDFALAAESGKPLTALIITSSGKSHETPLAIVVASDIASIVN